MNCGEKQKIERLKDLNHAKVLACQSANITGVALAVVRMTHHCYGDYYDSMNYEEAKAKNIKPLKVYRPGDTMAVSKGN
jgi:hypothetical protein